MENNIGKKVIIRGDRSGVEFGELVEYNGSVVTLKNARRLMVLERCCLFVSVSYGRNKKTSRLQVYCYCKQYHYLRCR